MLTILFLWQFIGSIALIPVGYTVSIVLLISLIGRLMVHLRFTHR
jgi:hypothetical protein